MGMESFVDLYERRADYVYFMCSRLELDSDIAQRLTQAVWRRVRRQLPQLAGKREEHWLCSKIIDVHRKFSRKVATDESGKVAGLSEEQRLTSALMRLSLEFRWPLVLREFAGFDYDDIADIIGIPEGTVRARMGRARALLNKYQEEQL